MTDRADRFAMLLGLSLRAGTSARPLQLCGKKGVTLPHRKASAKASLLTLCLLLATSPAVAQQQPSLDGQSKGNATIQFPLSQVSSEIGLTYGKDINRDQQYREVFKLLLRRGEAVVLDMQSSVFDAKLQVLAADGRELAFDDDSAADGRSARLVFTSPEDKGGAFYVVASSVDKRDGKFLLTATPRRAPLTSLVAEIQPSQPVQGRFDKTSALNVKDQTMIASYWFEASAGERIQIEGRSPTLGLDLILLRGDQQVSDGGTSSKGASLYHQVNAGGRHQINLVTKSESEGDYSLLLKKLPRQMAVRPPRPLLLGQPVTGTFDELTSTISPTSNRPYVLFVLDGTAGDRISVSAELENTGGSEGYDASPVTLSAGADTPAGFAEVSKVVSQPGTGSAQLTVTFARSGPLLVRLAGRSGAVTSYTLAAKQAEPRSSAAPVSSTRN